MHKNLKKFEKIVRQANNSSHNKTPTKESPIHPFDERNIHPRVSKTSKKLFDDGHYSQAVFESYKLLDKIVKGLSKVTGKSGYALMMNALDEKKPKIQLNTLSNESEIDEQMGYKFIFSGAMSAIRNPRGHEVGNIDTVEQCLDYLSFASMLIRRMNNRVSP